jgi:hypothetical protein
MGKAGVARCGVKVLPELPKDMRSAEKAVTLRAEVELSPWECSQQRASLQSETIDKTAGVMRLCLRTVGEWSPTAEDANSGLAVRVHP